MSNSNQIKITEIKPWYNARVCELRCGITFNAPISTFEILEFKVVSSGFWCPLYRKTYIVDITSEEIGTCHMTIRNGPANCDWVKVKIKIKHDDKIYTVESQFELAEHAH